MSRVRFIMVGGFLGAGKTTTLARLAKHYIDRGSRIGLVTNDQAQNLVDTNSLRSQGFSVQEVPGACFCCKFDELIERVSQLEESERPDIILAEPVGSCTDLVATVVQPLKSLYGNRFSVGPFSVIFKPSHGLKILKNESSGFSPKAAYIFRKQLEEADAIAINRIDELAPAQLSELKTLLADQFPGVPVFAISAKTGQGFELYTELLEQDGNFGRRILDIDYDIYAEGEAEMGWLNMSSHLSAESPFDLDVILQQLMEKLSELLKHSDCEIAHLKAISLEDGGAFAVANLVANDDEPKLSLLANTAVRDTNIIVNARVAIDPEKLEIIVRDALNKLADENQLKIEFRQSQQLRPGRPTPTHRMSSETINTH